MSDITISKDYFEQLLAVVEAAKAVNLCRINMRAGNPPKDLIREGNYNLLKDALAALEENL